MSIECPKFAFTREPRPSLRFLLLTQPISSALCSAESPTLPSIHFILFYFVLFPVLYYFVFIPLHPPCHNFVFYPFSSLFLLDLPSTTIASGSPFSLFFLVFCFSFAWTPTLARICSKAFHYYIRLYLKKTG